MKGGFILIRDMFFLTFDMVAILAGFFKWTSSPIYNNGDFPWDLLDFLLWADECDRDSQSPIPIFYCCLEALLLWLLMWGLFPCLKDPPLKRANPSEDVSISGVNVDS
jgi:hypothetical protein